MANGSKIRSNPYRWVVLAVFMMIMGVQQLLWINFASVTSAAASYYKVSDLGIGFLSMIFMIIYVLISIPASWMIDTYGFKAAAGIGALLTGIFGMLRGIFAPYYTVVMVCQIGIAIGQPFIVNAVTKVAARWFAMNERATATGLSWLAGYVGLIAGLVLTPYIADRAGMQKMLEYYGVVSMVCALCFMLFAREKPAGVQYAAGNEEKVPVPDRLRMLLSKRDFILINAVFFIGFGIFNGLATWIEEIVRPKGFSSAQAGIMGGLMIICGVLGSGVIPALSDRFRNRSRFIVLAVAGCVPGLIGIAFARDYWLLLVSACILGFFMLSTAPVGFQYCAEVGYPVPEGTSTGIMMMMGQLAGILFIFGMDFLKSPKDGSMLVPMLLLIILMLFNTLISARLKESDLLLGYGSDFCGVPEGQAIHRS